MLVNGIIVHHKGNVYRLCHPNGTVLADVKFPSTGDTIEESRVVKIFIKHMKDIWGIN